MKTQFEMVKEFREQVELPVANAPTLLSEADILHHTQHLIKKISEIIEANRTKDLQDIAELTVDLVYLTMGMAHNMGLPFNELFNAVHASNLMKEKGSDWVRTHIGCEWHINRPIGYMSPQGIENILVDAKALNS
jgi:predicted HAD superfamily Cof-like phosphohydrolase